jgi:TfoX/Sxy family transcriptional regulator of competence genes
MASRQDTADYLLEQIARAGPVSAKKMFGEYAIYCGGKVVALLCDDQLFLKPTVAGRALLGKAREGSPYPGAKPHLVIDADLWEDADWMADLIRATAQELPAPKPKGKKRPAKKLPAKKWKARKKAK